MLECVCVCVPVHSGEKWQGEERGYYFCREAGRQTPHSSLLISSRWPKFELLCSSPPLSIPGMADMVIIAECQAPRAYGNT